MKKLGYVLLALVMIATSAWAVDQTLPKDITRDTAPDEMTAAVAPEVSGEELTIEIPEMTDEELAVPLIAGGCCWAECANQKNACMNACAGDPGCGYSCGQQYSACLASC